MNSKRLRRKTYRKKKKEEKLFKILLEESTKASDPGTKEMVNIRQDKSIPIFNESNSHVNLVPTFNCNMKMPKEGKQQGTLSKLSEESLKKRYNSIPIEDRLPVGILEITDSVSDDETPIVISNDKNLSKDLSKQDNLVDAVEQCTVKDQIWLPQIRDAVLLPIEEPLPSISCVCENSIACTRECHEHIIKARAERNDALLLLRQYRNMAEHMEKQKQEIKKQMVSRVECIKNFWRNQVVEGGSRSGKILRASLIRK